MSKVVNVQVGGQGIGLGGILTILFVILKVTGYINWSWWWVFSPLWLPFAIVCGIMAIMMIGTLLVGIIALIIDKLT